jgi:hypothetical protein
MKTLDDLSEQIQEDVIGFLGGAHLNFSEDRQKDLICDLVNKNIEKYKLARGKQIKEFNNNLDKLILSCSSFTAYRPIK